MRIKLLSIFLLATVLSFGQTGQVSGTVTDENGKLLQYTTVYIKNLDKVIYTNSHGYFNTPKLPYGNYTFQFYSLGHQQIIDSIDIDQPNIITNTVVLKSLIYNLDEFEVNQDNSNGFNVRKMRAIEGVMITQGKKSEAIAIIDGEKFRLFTDEKTAWARDSKTDKKLVKAMRSGNQLVINGVSSRGSKTRDIYSLLGFTSAHNTINRTCK